MDNKKIKDRKMNDRLTHENGEGFINCDNCTKPHCNECEEFKAQAKRLAYFENAQQNKALAINCAGLNSLAAQSRCKKACITATKKQAQAHLKYGIS